MTAWHSKSRLIVVGLLLAALLFGTASMVWFQVTVPSPVQEIQVEVRGTDATPAVPALALVSAAAALALTIAGPRLRWVVAGALTAAAVGAVFSVVSAVADPERSAASTVGETAGIIGSQSQHSITVWPWLSLAMAVLLALAGAWILVAMRSWSTTGVTKYRRERDAGAATVQGASGAEAVDGGTGAVHDPDAARRDGIDTWDALSEGEDPTGR